MEVLIFNKVHDKLETFRDREESMEYINGWLKEHPEWKDELIIVEVALYNVLQITSTYSLENIPYNK